MTKITIITPVYEDNEAAGMLFKELAALEGLDIALVAVDDGSVKNPLEVATLADSGLTGEILELRRNVGHQKAIAIGLHYAFEHHKDSDYVLVMDSDGEDRPGTIAQLVEEIAGGGSDVVVAQRLSRVESLRFKLFYSFYKKLFKLFSGRKISFGNFMIMDRAALERITSMNEIWTHVAAGVLASKLRVAMKPIARGARYAGKSKMNFVGLALHGFKALMVFAEDVLVRVGLICIGLFGAILLLAVVALGLKIGGLATPGWFSIAVGILGILALQAGSLALMAFMNLMLTGIIRNSGSLTMGYAEYVKRVLRS